MKSKSAKKVKPAAMNDIKTTATNKKLRLLLKGIEDGTLIPRPDFQRRLVWKNDEKIAFIRTILEGYPFPEIYISSASVDADSAAAIEYLVDGQQRITTLYAYWKGNDDIKITAELKPFNELTEDEKTAFMQYDVVVRDLGEMPIEDIKTIFRRINATSYSLNAMEIHNARFDGYFKNFGEKFSEHTFFEAHKFFNKSDYKRMNDVRYCLVIVSTLLSTYFEGDDSLETFLANYNDEFPPEKKIQSRLNSAISIIEKCNFSSNSRVWNKADMFTLFVELGTILQKSKTAKELATIQKRLKSFYKKLDSISNPEDLTGGYFDYFKAALQGSNSKSRRITRGKILRNYLLTGKV